MKYKETKPCLELAPYIHSFWELKGDDNDSQWERIFPDGCPGLVINLGAPCETDNGAISMDYGKTYVVGAMTSFKDSFIDTNTHLLGVCLKPAAFSNFYSYAPQHELTNSTVEFDNAQSFNIEKVIKGPSRYLDKFFMDRINHKNKPLQSIIEDIHNTKGQLGIYEVAKRNYTTIRQLERNFKIHIGITPKEYTKIVRFQSALSVMTGTHQKKSLADIAFECGFYDHAHLTHDIKRYTGRNPSHF